MHTVAFGHCLTLRFIACTAPCFYPLPDIRWAIFQLNTLGFAVRKKPYGFPIHKSHFFQIESYDTHFSFGIEKLPQLGNMLFLNPAAESKNCELLVCRSFNLQHPPRT